MIRLIGVVYRAVVIGLLCLCASLLYVTQQSTQTNTELLLIQTEIMVSALEPSSEGSLPRADARNQVARQ